MIAVDDIGAFAALAFGRPNDFLGRVLELAGDELTMPEVAEAFGRAIGRPVRYVEQPLEQLRGTNSDAAAMLRWFNEHGFQANIPALRALYPQLTDLPPADRLRHVATRDRLGPRSGMTGSMDCSQPLRGILRSAQHDTHDQLAHDVSSS
jgi:uncharacterized protein YbjT (DUF2867 family)